METGTIVTLIIIILFVVAMAVPLLNSLASSVGATAYNEQLLMNASIPTSAAHDITSVTSLSIITYHNATNSTNAPGSVTFTLASTPPAASTLNVTTTYSGNVSVNGHNLGAVNGSGGVFSVPYTYLHAGTNTVVIG